MRPSITQTLPAGNPFDALAAALLVKLDIEQADFAMLCGTTAEKPPQTFCHDLADRWASAHKGDVVLRGWLLDAEADPDTYRPYRFIAHSVVLTARGNLIDVTLPATERSRRFVAHPYDVCGFFGILCSPPLANTLQAYVAPGTNL